jgi:protein-disulfide isomerase
MTRRPGGRLAIPVRARDHILGSTTAPVKFVEYGDYQCPHCGAAHPLVKTLQQRLANVMGFIFRHFPLNTVHPHAQQAAEAAEAAGAQGQFWEMHDMLFENQLALDVDHLGQYALEVGLDLSQFSMELAMHTHADRVREDFMGGVRSGVNGTPTFFINGIRYDGPVTLNAIVDAVEGAVESRT